MTMTTIAYRDGVLASESRLTEKGFIYTDNCQKLWRLKDGSLFGASGDDEGGVLLLQALLANAKTPELVGTRGIRIQVDEAIWIYEGTIWREWPEPYVAIGSGKRFAMTALHL